MATLFYIHDPMCSWCYAFSRTLDELRNSLPSNIAVKPLVGGLAPDSSQAMSPDMKTHVQFNWRKIGEELPWVRFNWQFWERCHPRRSTYPACRAVIAARQQSEEMEWPMIKAIQTAYYQQAMNPSDDQVLVELARSLALDTDRFISDLNSDNTNAALIEEVAQSRQLGVRSFPSLRLESRGDIKPIAISYNDANEILAQLGSLDA
ncbi:MAG: DsbA family protein [bacterium]